MTNQESLRGKLIECFDIARQEGVLHSKNGKHSKSSEADADQILSLFLAEIEGAELEDEEMYLAMADEDDRKLLEQWGNAKVSKAYHQVIRAQLDKVKKRFS